MFRKGFSLIEILVVLGVIGILLAVMIGTFGGARRQARDDRRVADLRQVQQALQLFYLKCGFYPGEYDVSNHACKLGDAVNPTSVPQNWGDLTAFLRAAEIGFGEIPNDPVPGREYYYLVQLSSTVTPVTPRGQCYVLKAALETDHKSLKDPKELETSDLIPNLFPTPQLDCDDDANKNNYCVGNSECFYGR